MASIRQFRKKIKSAKNIAKITKAMQMVAASKMKRAQLQADMGKEYATEVMNLSSMLSIRLNPSLHQLLQPHSDTLKTLVILIAPEKGLCGGLLTTLGRKLLLTYPKISDVDFIAIGKKARNIIERLGGNIIAQFSIGFSQPTFEIVPQITRLAKDIYLNGSVGRVAVVYMEYINTMHQEPMEKKLLPLSLVHQELRINEDQSFEYLFEPSADEIVEGLLSRYLEVETYQFLVEAYASEQSARMVAMKNATDNANSLISDLTLSFNKARQAGITAELIDISAANLIGG